MNKIYVFDLIIKAGTLKVRYKMSLADSIGLGETIICNGTFVTAYCRQERKD